ncbi:unnamed protein product [Mesocestoides corti]|uniref:LRRCT domain-containing protein n=1 Tax=Mesocestoides corti TaxID=53468 RepID=A0A0R3UQD1_MESCO|nr:unnamed protein product [Mesocestoides corti]
MVTARCSCSSGTCTCSGSDVTDLSGLLAEGICGGGGPFTKLILVDVPNLTHLPHGFTPLQGNPCVDLRRLEVLGLHGTGIQNLSSNLFKGLSNLRKLDLSNNSQLKSYRDGSFEPLGSTLNDLVASGNRVHSLTRGVFSGLHRLQRLILSHNKIGYIEDGVFSADCCSQLVELSLEGNILTDLENTAFVGLSSLRKLDLQGNPLQRLSPGLFNPFSGSLTHLFMSHDDTATFGGFDSFPDMLFSRMSHLEELSMVELKICNLTADSFVGLTNLRKLSLHGNRLTMFPKNCFTSMPQLVELDLSANGLFCIPDNYSEHYPALRSLDLSRNGLTHLTRESFSMLGSSLPTAAFPKLIVNISSNPIQRIEPDAFCSFNGPVDLIVAPPGSNPPAWASMDGWPDNPFALVGNDSIIQGLSNTEPVRGRPDAATFCGPEGKLFHAKILDSSLYSQSKHTKRDIETSLNSGCPWLLPGQLSQWQLSKLGVPGLARAPGSAGDKGYALEEGSRIYLLIIVAVCITFLLAALTTIMCYRAWSRRATQKMTGDAEANIFHGACGPSSAEPLATAGDVSEKNELLERPRNGLSPTLSPLNEASGESNSTTAVNGSQERRTSRNGRHNSEPKVEELETMTAFGVL